MSEAHLVLRWLHILSGTILFGTGLGTAFFLYTAYRMGHVPALHRIARLVVRADWLFTLTSGVVQPVTGIALIVLVGYDPLEPWLLATYGLYAVAFGCWVVVVWQQLRVRDLAGDAERGGTALPPELHRRMRLWFVLGWPAFLGLLAVFWLMVAKPG